VLALAARWPLVARIEGALDHDQSVVGLMALDIAAGRRFPIFFDGQRYMGAIEPYVAAGFVRVFGHGLTVVALAPWLVFGLFVAAQFAVWRHWEGRATGHLAATLTLIGAPLITVWGLIPRGGYVEMLAWALPTLAAYRVLTRAGRGRPSPALQAAWGCLLAVGYFVNPLSLTVYATIAMDWAFRRRGADLRSERAAGRTWKWLDAPTAPWVWLALGFAWLCGLAAFCYVDPRKTEGGTPYVVLLDLLPWAVGLPLGALGVAGLLGVAAWWSRFPQRLVATISAHPWSLLGVLAALWPFVAYGVLTRLGFYEPVPALPTWVTAPWKAGSNLVNGARALATLVGSDPRAVESVLIGQGLEPPGARHPALAQALITTAPLVVAVAAGLLGWVAWRVRGEWIRMAALRGEEPSSPAALAVMFLAVAVGLYLLQGSSPNASSVRYLVPVWVALPGVLAVGVRSLPVAWGWLAGAWLVVPWGAAQWEVWEELDRPAPTRLVASVLERRGVTGVVAPTPLALTVANLTHGRVGAMEYQALWPRLSRRYVKRFDPAGPVVCVTDRRFPWAIRGEGAWSPEQDLRRHLLGLGGRYPGSIRLVQRLGPFEIWEADRPLEEVLAAEPGAARDGPRRGRQSDDSFAPPGIAPSQAR
jgi:hypothetical protein